MTRYPEMPIYFRQVPGWGRFSAFYERIAETVPAYATLVEIGVWQGRSAIFMAEKLKELNKPVSFYLVDSFDGGKILANEVKGLDRPLLEIVRDNVERAGVSAQITEIIALSSVEAAARFDDLSVDFAFIDADHDYASVRADVLAWWPKMKIGGLISGHDYVSGWVGVAKAVDELVARHHLDFHYEHDAWQIRKRPVDPPQL